MTPPTAVASSARRTMSRRFSARCSTPPAVARRRPASTGPAPVAVVPRRSFRALVLRRARGPTFAGAPWRRGPPPRAAPGVAGSAAGRVWPSPRSSSRCSGSVRCRIARSSAGGRSIERGVRDVGQRRCERRRSLASAWHRSALANFAVKSQRTSAPVASSTTTRPCQRVDGRVVRATCATRRAPGCRPAVLPSPGCSSYTVARAPPTSSLPAGATRALRGHQIEDRERRAQRLFQQAAGLGLLGDAADHLPIA